MRNETEQPLSLLAWKALCLVVCAFTVVAATRASASKAAADADLGTVALASPEVALTFARIRNGHARTVVAVTDYTNGIVRGVDLSIALDRHINDAIITFHDQGYDGLRRLLTDATPDARVEVSAADLVLPIDLLDRHIAAGTNFSAHAGEAGVEGGPFLFSKQVRATGPYAEVSAGDALLDYEVEVAWVPLDVIERGAKPEWMGLLACNDYTDRATLLRNINVDDVGSGDGFTTGKSFEGYLPVGTLFVIPRDYRAFARDLGMTLWVNGEQRQSAPVSAAIWDIDELLEQAWQRQDRRWLHRGAEVSLLDARDTINARTMIMSGTPAGTIFEGISMGQKVRGIAAWAFGGWGRSPAANVIEVYIEDARSDRRFLQPGDTVTVRVDHLGVISNEIAP